MKTTRIKEPEAVYEAALRAITTHSSETNSPGELSRIFAPSFHFFGSCFGEEINSPGSLQRLLEKEKKHLQLKGLKISLESEPVFRSYSPDGKAVIMVNHLNYLHNGTSQTLPFRISLVLYKIEKNWKVTHVHISIPARMPEPQSEDLFPEHSFQERLTKLEEELRNHQKSLKKKEKQLDENRKRLIRQEKLAGLGQLTAGIAHEIKNPLNFITNFSELSSEFLEEIEENLEKLDQSEIILEIKELLDDVKGNLLKIHQHGSRADSIVKSMLLHSRGGSGKMDDTDLNALLREFVNLSFHGMRANRNPINVDINVETDDNINTASINAEDFSRVVLNLCKNAFDAMREKLKQEQDSNYLPILLVRTRINEDKILVEFEDNGPGISEEIMKKIMQPFFTTKKGNEGTGLGLSISQEIIKNHGGHLKVESREGEFTRFTIVLNNNDKKQQR